jgi:hypothetical protein
MSAPSTAPTTRLTRAISEPTRSGLTWAELWEGPDHGLIWCWERGRQMRGEAPELAARAGAGELVSLAWKGGVTEKLKVPEKPGTLQYLATWQGLRGEDLDIDVDGRHVVICARTGQGVAFSATLPDDDA